MEELDSAGNRSAEYAMPMISQLARAYGVAHACSRALRELCQKSLFSLEDSGYRAPMLGTILANQSGKVVLLPTNPNMEFILEKSPDPHKIRISRFINDKNTPYKMLRQALLPQFHYLRFYGPPKLEQVRPAVCALFLEAEMLGWPRRWVVRVASSLPWIHDDISF